MIETSILHVGPRIARFTDDERERHVEASICKSRGGSPLVMGARSPGRWDPGCSCGWRASSNEDKREATVSWREHRSTAVFEERQLAKGEPIFRVVVERKGYTVPTQEWRGFETEEAARQRAADLHDPTGPSYLAQTARAERSADGVTWEVLS